jgi:stress responsive alpha/beta barrel protein
MRWFMSIVAAMVLVAMLSAVDPVAAQETGKKQLNHVVLIKFKPSATPEQIKKVEEAFAGLKEKVPGVTSLRYGTNVSPEKKNKGYTHAFILTFNSDKDRDAYLVHPAHKAFGGVLGPVLGDVLVIDFWAQE